MTRSTTRRLAVAAIERQRAIDHVKLLLIASQTTNNMQQRCAIMNDAFCFVLQNSYMNKIMEEDLRFRYTLYDKCNEYMVQSTCTDDLAQTCERLRSKIMDIVQQQRT